MSGCFRTSSCAKVPSFALLDSQGRVPHLSLERCDLLAAFGLNLDVDVD